MTTVSVIRIPLLTLKNYSPNFHKLYITDTLELRNIYFNKQSFSDSFNVNLKNVTIVLIFLMFQKASKIQLASIRVARDIHQPPPFSEERKIEFLILNQYLYLQQIKYTSSFFKKL